MSKGLEPIAIVGLACRVPGANAPEQFWQNLRAGVESIRQLTDSELREAGVDPKTFALERYVRARAVLDGDDLFDAGFFGYSAREASTMDPQHRVFLECAWEAVEDAGWDVDRLHARTSVFAGVGLNTYLVRQLATRPDVMRGENDYELLLGNDKDFVATRVSYKLNLKGPSLSISTACSSSLVAIHAACQSLWSCQCDAALAGGVSIRVPQGEGYLYQEGMVLSPDGHCRAFDARAAGTVSGSGAGVVVLKRLEDALADGDDIRALIRGAAINNDGANKVGFSAPSVDGQAEVIAEALALAEVEPATIGYVEAHGTGTPLGDPIEVAALTQAFRAGTSATNFCALGSVKTNLGHLDAAAGVAGLIKTVLALQHREIPASLHFENPNPKINFASSPFFVNAQTRAWPKTRTPRRAGVSSFGMGGTNAHIVLEESPALSPGGPAPKNHLLVLSARSEAALAQASARLAERLAQWRGAAENLLADVAYTLATGRRAFACRRAIVCGSIDQAIRALHSNEKLSTGGDAALNELAQRWLAGSPIDWAPHFAGQKRRRVPLPTYPFERQRYWIDAPAENSQPLERQALADWFYVPSWKRAAPAQADQNLAGRWLVLGDDNGVGQALADRMARRGAAVEYRRAKDVATKISAEWGTLLERGPLSGVVYCGALNATGETAEQRAESGIAWAYGGLLKLAQAMIAGRHDEGLQLVVLTGATREVTGLETLRPEQSVAHGLIKVLPLEQPWLRCRSIDLEPGGSRQNLAQQLCAEIAAGHGAEVALRGAYRWIPGYEPLTLDKPAHGRLLKERGVYLITGGLGGIGLEIARALAQRVRARLVLLTRSPLPPRGEWESLAPRTASTNAQPFDTTTLTAVEARLDRELAIRPIASHAGLRESLHAFCTALILRYFAQNGISPQAGETAAVSALRQHFRILPKFERFFDFMLHALAEDGVVRVEGDRLEWLEHTRGRESATAIQDRIAKQHPGFAPMLRGIEYCSRHYTEALSGRIEAIEVLYPKGESSFIEECVQQTTPHTREQLYLGVLREFVADWLTRNSGRKLRILEIGAGKGILTRKIIDLFAGQQVEYHFTDIGRSFVLEGSRKAAQAGHSFMKFGTLDISRDGASQGYAPGSFDLILELDAVHATPTLSQTMSHVKNLLAPGGVLCLVESTNGTRWNTMAMGLAEGWWYYQDTDLRRYSPMLTLEQWEAVLARTGFEHCTAFPRPGPIRRDADCGLIMACAPGTVEQEGGAKDLTRIQRCLGSVRQIEAAGGEVLVLSTKVEKADELRAAIERATRHFGHIDGVFHLASKGRRGPIELQTADISAGDFGPKVRGTDNLFRCLEKSHPDFVVLFSSIGAIVPGPGDAEYSSANAFLDASAWLCKDFGRVVAIDWDRWRHTGMAVGYERLCAEKGMPLPTSGLSPEEGFEALLRVLESGSTPQMMVLVSDFNALRRRAPQIEALSAATPKDDHAVAEGGSIEDRLGSIWREVLGVEQVASTDDFNELGGDSLIAIKVVSRVRDAFGVELTVRTLFENPMLGQLTAYITSHQTAPNPGAGNLIEEGQL